jgi:hypothetical protein
MKNFNDFKNELPIIETVLFGKQIQMGDRRGRVVKVISHGDISRYDTVYSVKFHDGTQVQMHDSMIRPFIVEEHGAGEEGTDELDDTYREETPGEEVQEARKDVYAIVDKKGKVVAANLTKQNAHKEISRHRDGTIVLDPDAKVGDVLKTFASESVEESAPMNSVGGGMSPHMGGEGNVQGTDAILMKKKRKKFAGAEVFELTSDDYHNCMHGRQRYERWNKRMNMENIDNQEIRSYAHKNPGKPIVVQDMTTGIMSYLIHGDSK